ncbi:TPA: hypothetical protein ACNEJR_004682 [Escherichia coli]
MAITEFLNGLPSEPVATSPAPDLMPLVQTVPNLTPRQCAVGVLRIMKSAKANHCMTPNLAKAADAALLTLGAGHCDPSALMKSFTTLARHEGLVLLGVKNKDHHLNDLSGLLATLKGRDGEKK